MPANTSVKYLHSGMTGAPTLTGQAGTLIAVLDACLINGFASATLDSLSVSSNVATATRAAGHPFEVGSVVEISGATPAGLNGQHKVTAITTTTYQFETSGVANGPATGTITHKLAPLGWTKQFSGTNLAAYKSTHIESTGCLLRINDSTAEFARCVGYETMSDINTGTGPFPTNDQQSGGYFWVRAETADATSRPWIIVGDERAFYMWVNYGTSSNLTYTFMTYFGDFISKVPGDAYGCALSAQSVDRSGSIPGTDCFSYSSGSVSNLNSSLSLARRYTGLGSAFMGGRLHTPAQVSSSLLAGYSGSFGMFYPNVSDNALYVTPYYVGDGQAFRGTFPGCYFVPHFISTGQFVQGERISGLTGLSGKTIAMVSLANGPIAFDVTGPWR